MSVQVKMHQTIVPDTVQKFGKSLTNSEIGDTGITGFAQILNALSLHSEKEAQDEGVAKAITDEALETNLSALMFSLTCLTPESSDESSSKSSTSLENSNNKLDSPFTLSSMTIEQMTDLLSSSLESVSLDLDSAELPQLVSLLSHKITQLQDLQLNNSTGSQSEQHQLIAELLKVVENDSLGGDGFLSNEGLTISEGPANEVPAGKVKLVQTLVSIRETFDESSVNAGSVNARSVSQGNVVAKQQFVSSIAADLKRQQLINTTRNGAFSDTTVSHEAKVMADGGIVNMVNKLAPLAEKRSRVEGEQLIYFNVKRPTMQLLVSDLQRLLDETSNGTDVQQLEQTLGVEGDGQSANTTSKPINAISRRSVVTSPKSPLFSLIAAQLQGKNETQSRNLAEASDRVIKLNLSETSASPNRDVTSSSEPKKALTETNSHQSGAVNHAILMDPVGDFFTSDNSEVSIAKALDLVEEIITSTDDSKTQQNMILRLHPKELGELKVSVMFRENNVTAEILASSSEALKLLETSLPQLKTAIMQHGINLQEFNLGMMSQNNGGGTAAWHQNKQQQQSGNYGRLYADKEDLSTVSEVAKLATAGGAQINILL